MIYGLDQFRDYFAGLQADLAPGGSFVFGGSERALRLLADPRGVTYPLVWLNWPVVEVLPIGNESFSADLFLLTGAANDQEKEDAALLDMYDLGQRLIKRIKNDADDGKFMASGSAVLQPRFRSSADNMAGYVLEAGLTLGTSGCLNKENF